MTNRNYTTPAVDARWSDVRETDHAVAVAIHAIAGADRTPEAIWEDPTPAEWDHVEQAVQEYVTHGDFAADDNGYQWGQERIEF